MTPSQYEKLVAEHFKRLGYKIEVTSYSNDYGVDVFATNGAEKLAIQAKMYGGCNRPVNREMILLLQGSKDYFECTRAVIATDGNITPDALEVATKLKIEIVPILSKDLITECNLDEKELPKSEFDILWQEHVMPLQGKTIRNDGLENEIVSVDWSGVKRITENGNRNSLPIESFRRTVNHILEHGSITRKTIDKNYVSRGSSGVILILSQVPIFEYRKKPNQELKLKGR